MELLGYLLLGAGVIFVLLLVVSPKFRSAVSARIPWFADRATSAVDSVESRTAAAAAAQDSTVRRGRRSLYQVQQELAASEMEINRAAKEIDEDNAALALAHKNNDRETFGTLAEELNRDRAYHAQLVANHKLLVGELKNLEVGVDEQREKQRMIGMQGSLMRSQARVADVTASVQEARAGLDDNSADAHMEAAQKMLDRSMARATASKNAAEGLTPNERADKKAAAYIKQARQGTTGINADALWEQMNAPAAPTPAP